MRTHTFSKPKRPGNSWTAPTTSTVPRSSAPSTAPEPWTSTGWWTDAAAQVPQRRQGHAAGIARAAGRGGAAQAHGRAQGGHPGHLSHHLHHPADTPARDRAGVVPQLQPLDGRMLETVRQPPALGGGGAAAEHRPSLRGGPAGQGERRGGHLHARLRGRAAAERSPLLSGLRRRQQARHPGVHPLLQRQLRALRLLQVRDRGLLEVQAGGGGRVPHHHHGQDPRAVPEPQDGVPGGGLPVAALRHERPVQAPPHGGQGLQQEGTAGPEPDLDRLRDQRRPALRHRHRRARTTWWWAPTTATPTAPPSCWPWTGSPKTRGLRRR